ncbi:MAG TPA: hypothetical protein VFZ93_03725 [Albitalea sp.]
MLEPLTPFPVLMVDEPVARWRWPALPFDWRHGVPADEEAAPACRLETPTGSAVHGFLVNLHPAGRYITFRTTTEAPTIDLPFARFRGLTLTTPLRSVDQYGRVRRDRIPVAAHMREYRLHRDDGLVTGRTCGHVENEAGLFLFAPGEDEFSLMRLFVPRTAYHRFELGPSALDAAAEKWIATPRELLAAAERQRRMSIQPIGKSLVELGMITQEQLEQALAQPNPDVPLGERMVQSGLISKADLQTAIAHKMGYPFVDLKRFPIDPGAARKLPLRMAVANRALPIMMDDQRLFVAVDRPARTVELSSIYALTAFTVVPVIASKGAILLALSKLSDQDLWHDHVSVQPNFTDTAV